MVKRAPCGRLRYGPGMSRSRLADRAALSSLVLGLAIYLLARDGLYLHRALAALGIPAGTLRAAFPAWLAYVVPDGLWQLAFCAVVAARWWDRPPSRERTLWLAAPLAIGLGIEGASAFGWVEGVFDPLDVAAMALGGGLGYALARRHTRRHTRRDASRAESAALVAAFCTMLAATSKPGTGPIPVGAGGSPAVAPGFALPDDGSWTTTDAAPAGLTLRLPPDASLKDSGTLSAEPIGPYLGLVLPSGYEVRIDTAPADLAEALRNARAHEARGSVHVLLADPDAVVADYGSGCRALACKPVAGHTLCGSIGKRTAHDGGAAVEQHPTRDDCGVLVAAIRSLAPR